LKEKQNRLHSPNELGSLIGRGRTAEVFAWGEGQALKLFFADHGPGGVRREAHAGDVLSRLAVPAPRYHGSIQIGDRTGLVFDRVLGYSLLSLLARQPWRVLSVGKRLADVHFAIHASRVSELLSQLEFARQRIERAPDVREDVRRVALERLAQLPDGDRLCHGDFHPDNVVITATGPMVIDWENAGRGNPAGDVARTLLLLGDAELPPGTSLVMKLLTQGMRQVLVAAYWRRYAERSGMHRADVDAWRMPLVAARLAEGIPAGERRRLLSQLELRETR
jgi:aminoglycoside phosphotransferase (APT) family kinase protein